MKLTALLSKSAGCWSTEDEAGVVQLRNFVVETRLTRLNLGKIAVELDVTAKAICVFSAGCSSFSSLAWKRAHTQKKDHVVYSFSPGINGKDKLHLPADNGGWLMRIPIHIIASWGQWRLTFQQVGVRCAGGRVIDIILVLGILLWWWCDLRNASRSRASARHWVLTNSTVSIELGLNSDNTVLNNMASRNEIQKKGIGKKESMYLEDAEETWRFGCPVR